MGVVGIEGGGFGVVVCVFVCGVVVFEFVEGVWV